MTTRVSSMDDGYEAGDLSVYPETIDNTDTLYEAKNNAATTLKQTLPVNGTYIVVNDASGFPSKGLIRLGPTKTTIPSTETAPTALDNSGVPGHPGVAEMVYYGERTGTVFKQLIRGFAGSRQSQWSKGIAVSNAVFAEHHNAIKDAIINIETHLGSSVSPTDASVNGVLKSLEDKFLAPKPLFRAYPLKGKSSLSVRFQNFSSGNVIRYLWDFGDGTTSIEKSPTHIYSTEGFYTVSLNVITTTGAQGIATKNNYIEISDDEVEPFFYIIQTNPSNPAYSQQTAASLSATPATFSYVDQTQGDIAERFWIFGDGETLTLDDPNEHTTTHIYATPGTYEPTLLVVFADQSYKRSFLSEELVIL